MSSSKKVYGLILPPKHKDDKKLPALKKPSVFAEDDDDSDEGRPIRKTSSATTSAKKTFLKKQVQLDIEKALAEDPNAFDYDEVYDQVQAKKLERSAVEKSNVERKPKFIHSLLKAADQRKKEDERRVERSVQREREAEKGQYDDKDSFVTESFRQKMRDMKEEEERECKKRELEELNDVTKTGDYRGFYQTLLNQKTGQPEVKVKSEMQESETKHRVRDRAEKKEKCDKDADSNARQRNIQPGDHRLRKQEDQRKRARGSDSESSDEDLRHHKKMHKVAGETSPEKTVPIHTGDTDISMSESSTSSDDEASESDVIKEVPVSDSVSGVQEKMQTTAPVDPKQAIFAKKTTGDMLSDAQMRYLARKGAIKVAIANEDD